MTAHDASPRHDYALSKVRHEPRRRTLTLEAITRLSPGMLRLTFTSPDLADFPSQSPDDHVKVMLPAADGTMIMRDYTPRAFDRASSRLVIDFAIHEAGPATAWALSAAIGDTLIVGGPRGSSILPDGLDWLVLAGDETALPAIGRRIEEAPAGMKIISLVVTEAAEDRQHFETRADWTGLWAARQDGSDQTALIEMLNQTLPKTGRGMVWVAAEAGVARAVRAHLLEDLALDPRRVKAAGYWVRGAPGGHERIE